MNLALKTSNPASSLLELAQTLADEGVLQSQMVEAFSDQLELEKSSSDETKWDALADTLDLIVGWCAPNSAIFPGSPSSDEK